VILAVALIFLGPSRLPDAARSVGRGMREFRESLSGLGDDHEEDPYDELEDDFEDEAVEPGADDPEQDEDEAQDEDEVQDEDEEEPEPAAETGADRA